MAGKAQELGGLIRVADYLNYPEPTFMVSGVNWMGFASLPYESMKLRPSWRDFKPEAVLR